MSNKEEVLAGIVTFNPDINRLKENIFAIITQVKKVVIVDNGSKNVSEIEELSNSDRSIEIIKLGKNLGIAAALNRIGDYAVANKFDYFLTLDQDSVVNQGLIVEYLKYTTLPKWGLLNSRRVDRNIPEEVIEREEILEEPMMITSGTFMSASLFEKGYRYDEELFIDYVDFDLAFSLINDGYKLYQIPFYGYLHEMGETTLHNFFGIKIKTYNHSSFRRYYTSRNSIILWKKYGITPLTKNIIFSSNFFRIVKVILFEKDKIKKTNAALRGFKDGFKYKNDKK